MAQPSPDITAVSDADLQQMAALQAMPTEHLLAAAQGPVTATNRAHAFEGGILGGIANTVALPFDIMAKSGQGLAQAALGESGGDPSTVEPLPLPSTALTNAMDKTQGNRFFDVSTNPERPDDAASRYLTTAGSVIPAVASMGAGTPGALATALKMARTAVPATGSALAGQYVGEAKPFGDNETLNRAAQIATQVGTSILAPGAAKTLIRGTGPMAERTAAFNAAGIQPTMAQAANNPVLSGTETLLAKLPGSAVKANKAEQAAGAANSESGRLFGELNDHIDPAEPVGARSTLGTLNSMSQPGTKLINPKLDAVRSTLMQDIGKEGSPTQVPFSTLSSVRSQIADNIVNGDLSGTALSQMKRLHGAVLEDMKGAANQWGPDASEAFQRAADHYKSDVAASPAVHSTGHGLGIAAGADIGMGLLEHAGVLPHVAPIIGAAAPLAYGADRLLASPSAINWAGAPIVGSTAQKATLLAAPFTPKTKQQSLADALAAYSTR